MKFTRKVKELKNIFILNEVIQAKKDKHNVFSLSYIDCSFKILDLCA